MNFDEFNPELEFTELLSDMQSIFS